jgi:hypothetical protein
MKSFVFDPMVEDEEGDIGWGFRMVLQRGKADLPEVILLLDSRPKNSNPPE